MIFKGINQQTVEFKILNYQFPEVQNCVYDSNWLQIYLQVKSDCGEWESTDPSLLVSEVKACISWFTHLANNQTVSHSLSFLEPNLEFILLKNESELKTVRIVFSLESRPKDTDNTKSYVVDCEWTPAELHTIVSQLQLELANFPERALN
ncbi:WapI family immunity protein [Formosa algae]|uniref:Uncharacterized protein n=1 Tax=Formosa algae TaxID=225843 RepID=A0A9X0YLG1_9FLAO|nr:hypothetical protein [Formosa algae]MBP1840789.1 hypothetical protein [Formosa algae]MDQ0336314.1 hypothetical protein [Formosa algae]OEI80340.1 hypothetical protein AST99_09995 [Formosa algae]